MCTAHAVYSYEDRYDNFVRAFKKAKLHDRKIDNVLILGFGLGSIPIILENKATIIILRPLRLMRKSYTWPTSILSLI